MATNVQFKLAEDSTKVRINYKALRSPSTFYLSPFWFDFLRSQIDMTALDGDDAPDRFIIHERRTTWTICWHEIASIEFVKHGKDSVEWAHLYGEYIIFKASKDKPKDTSVFFPSDTIWDVCFDHNDGKQERFQIRQDVMEELGKYWEDYTKKHIGTSQIKVVDNNNKVHAFDLSKIDALAYSAAQGQHTLDVKVPAGEKVDDTEEIEKAVVRLKRTVPYTEDRIRNMLKNRLNSGATVFSALKEIQHFAAKAGGYATLDGQKEFLEKFCASTPIPLYAAAEFISERCFNGASFMEAIYELDDIVSNNDYKTTEKAFKDLGKEKVDFKDDGTFELDYDKYQYIFPVIDPNTGRPVEVLYPDKCEQDECDDCRGEKIMDKKITLPEQLVDVTVYIYKGSNNGNFSRVIKTTASNYEEFQREVDDHTGITSMTHLKGIAKNDKGLIIPRKLIQLVEHRYIK